MFYKGRSLCLGFWSRGERITSIIWLFNLYNESWGVLILLRFFVHLPDHLYLASWNLLNFPERWCNHSVLKTSRSYEATKLVWSRRAILPVLQYELRHLRLTIFWSINLLLHTLFLINYYYFTSHTNRKKINQPWHYCSAWSTLDPSTFVCLWSNLRCSPYRKSSSFWKLWQVEQLSPNLLHLSLPARTQLNAFCNDLWFHCFLWAKVNQTKIIPLKLIIYIFKRFNDISSYFFGLHHLGSLCPMLNNFTTITYYSTSLVEVGTEDLESRQQDFGML